MMTNQNKKVFGGNLAGVLKGSGTLRAKNEKCLSPCRSLVGLAYGITVTPLRVRLVIFMIKTGYKLLVL